jgi:glutamate formiminotransferase
MAWIECVPNVSEGRRPAVVTAIVAAVRAVAGVHVLDVSSDPSHNRSVLTIAGTAATLKAAVAALFDAALPRIDLRAHTGEHPRLGAVDVVPFIPLEGSTMSECVALARETAAAVASRFGLPVFLYEQAARSPSRRNLADIRRGEFEGLAAKLARPEWQPDFGPAQPHPTAGATVIGARAPLVAFNVNLATDRVAIAKQIARAVRERDGGLPAVKALGLALADRGLTQVSMNLIDYTVTSIRAAFDAVKAEAERRGARVSNSEIVGLVPRAALEDGIETAIQLAGFDRRQVLEERLRESEQVAKSQVGK